MRSSFNQGWFARPKQNKFLEMLEGASEPAPVTLPHDAMIHTVRDSSASHANAYFPSGVWEYTKTFAVPSEWADRRVRLQFEGVYRDAVVYVNDDFAGNEPHGYGEFVVDLDPHLRVGEDNTVRVECRAGEDTRWYSGAGILRPVHLWVQDLVHLEIDGVWVTTPEADEDLAVLEIAAEIRNDSHRTVTLRMANTVEGPDGREVAAGSIPVTVRPRTTVTGRQRLHLADPELWHPDHPALHTCTTTLSRQDAAVDHEVDRATTRFGIRTLRLDPRHGLRINGSTVKMRGACVHHDNGPIGAAAIGRAEERRVELLQAAGFNALRSAHNPMSRAMLGACDRLGVLVMDEAWDMWTESKTDHDHALRFPDRWRHDVAAMVRKDRNHPSVVLYSTGNEIPEVGSPLGAALAREIAEEVRSLDPTRYVTTAVQPFLAIRDMIGKIREFVADDADLAPLREAGDDHADAGVNTMMSHWNRIKDLMMASEVVAECLDEVSASVDVVGYNYLDNRYVIDRERSPDRVIVGSETYASAIARAWPEIEQLDHVIGDFTWTGWDYLGEVGIGRTEHVDTAEEAEGGSFGVAAPYPWLVAHTGDLDITGHRRPQSWFREIVFGLRSDPFIAVRRPSSARRTAAYSGPWSWSDTVDSWSWAGAEGTELPVEVYAAADEVELLLDGASLGSRPAGVHHGFRAEFAVAYQPGEIVAVARTDGVETGRTALRTAGSAVELRATPDRVELSVDDELCFVAVAITDADGIVHPNLDRTVEATIDGPAEIVGFASADPTSEIPFPSPVCETFEGRALAVIRPTAPGHVELTFRAPEVGASTCNLQVDDA